MLAHTIFWVITAFAANLAAARSIIAREDDTDPANKADDNIGISPTPVSCLPAPKPLPPITHCNGGNGCPFLSNFNYWFKENLGSSISDLLDAENPTQQNSICAANDNDVGGTNADSSMCCVTWNGDIPGLTMLDLQPFVTQVFQYCLDESYKWSHIQVNGVCTNICVSNRLGNCHDN